MSGRLPPPRPQRSSGSLVTGPPSPAPSAASAVPISVPTSPTLAAAKPKASSARGNSSSGVGFGAGSGPTRGPSPASSPSPSPSHTPHSPSPGSSSPVPIHSPGHSAGEPNGKAPMAGAGAGPKVAVKVAVKRGASHRAPRKAPPAGALDDSEYDPSSPAFASPTPVRSGLSSSSSVASSPSSSSSSTHVTGAAPAAVPSTSPAGSRPAQAPVSASKPVPVAAAAGSSSAAAAGASLLAQKTTKAASPSPSSPSSPSSSSSISDAEAALRKRALPPTPQGGDVNQPTPSSPVPPPLSSKPTSPSLPASSPSSSSSQIPESPLASSSHSSAASSSASAASAPGSPVPAPRSGRNSPGLQHSVSVSSLPLSGSGSTSFSSFHNPGPMSPKPALPPKPKLISSPSLSSSSVAQFAGSSSSSSSSSSSGGGKPMLPNRPSSFSLTVGQDKAVLKSKQKTITPEDVDKISEALKKFGRANKQFTAVATMIISKADLKLKAKGKDKDKSADQIQSLRTQMEASKNQLKTPNDSFATELRDFKDTSDLLTTLKFLTRAAELTSFAAQLVAIGKALTLILEDDTLFKQMLTAISTTRDSLFELVEIYSSYDLGEDLSTNVSTAANNVEQSYNELVETRSDGNTQLIQSGKRLEIEAVARACVLALTKFVNSFGGRLTQNILLEAKVSSSTIVQLAATLNDLANTEHNLLSRKEIRNVILQDASSVKDTFLQFLDVAKREVSNPTPKTALIVQQASENVRNHIRQILSHINAFYAFTPNRSSASATDDNGLPEPSAVDLERAEKVCAIPDPIVPPPPPKEEESNQVPTCADSAPDIENIWEEPEDNDSNIQLTDANVVRIANLNKLIERLTSPSVHDLKFRDTFIATYRSFTTPEALLKKLIQRYTVPPKYQDQTRNIQLRICNVLKHWVETQFYDFGDSMQEKLFEFLDILELNAFYAKFTQKIRAFIQRKKEEEQNAKNEMINLTVEGTIPLPPANILFVFDEEEIARQLTLVDFSVYSSIQPVELLNQAWNKPKYKHRSKNVLTLITRSTNITLWAANIILWQSTLKDRTRAMTKLINIAEHLRKMNNFSSLMAIIAGINMAPVFRLKFTKQLLPESTQDIFQKLGDLMDPLMSYSNYRNALRHVNPPCVPFLGVYLSDITFVEDGNPDFINGLINYRKRELDYNVIQDIQKFQNIGYNFVLVDNIAHFLTELPAVTDNEELYQLSLTREPRNCTLESLT